MRGETRIAAYRAILMLMGFAALPLSAQLNDAAVVAGIQSGGNYLNPDSVWFGKANNCSSCHLQGGALYALSNLIRLGYPVDRSHSTGVGYLADAFKAEQQPGGQWTNAGTFERTKTSYALFGLAGYALNSGDASPLANIESGVRWALGARTQTTLPSDGNPFAGQTVAYWTEDHGSYPVTYGDVPVTARMMTGIAAALTDPALSSADRAMFTTALGSAADWMEGISARNHLGSAGALAFNFEAGYALIGLAAAGRTASGSNAAAQLIRDSLLAAQQPNSGWNEATWQPGAANTFSTGIVLTGLSATGMRLGDSPVVGQGLGFLLQSQNADRSWSLANHQPELPTAFALLALSDFDSPPSADSVTPNTGGGVSQAFTFQYSSVKGYGTLGVVYGLINGALTGTNGCYVKYIPGSNRIYLLSDNGSVYLGPLTPGSNATLQNSSCTVNGGGSSVSGSGNALTVTFALSFSPGFIGNQTLYGYALDSGNLNSGWRTLGSWATSSPVSTPPAVVSASPSGGTGSQATFNFTYSSPNGYQYINFVYALLNWNLAVGHSCLVEYVQSSNALYLLNDNATAYLGPLTPGTAGTLQNGQCTVSGPGSFVTALGNVLNVNVAVTFDASVVGDLNCYGFVMDMANRNSGWRTLGTWTPAAAVSTPPSVVGVNPSSGTGLGPQNFSFQYSSPNGFKYLSTVYALVNTVLQVPNGCLVEYIPNANAIYMINDGDTAWLGPLTLGGAGTLSNSVCTVNGLGSSASGSGTTLTLTLGITFRGSANPSQYTYGYAADYAGNISGWETLGNWNP